MRRIIRNYLAFTGQSIIFWMLAFSFLIVIRYFGIYEEKGVSILPKYQLSIWEMLSFSMLLSVPFGFFYAAVEFLFDRFLSKRLALGFVLFIKTFIYLLSLIVLLTYVLEITGYVIDAELETGNSWWHTNKTFWTMVIFFMIASLVFSFIKIANEKFGRGVFLKMLLGKYRNPKEEKRIFMFLDLRSSTTFAEKLGHYQYSQLIQDCLYDLNVIVRKFDADIYQYVGDEAVLSWEYNRGVKRNQVIRLYFAYMKRLQSRHEYYLKKYDLLPTFKAGIHGGTLMIAEVGSVKKELAYHGDVINSTARIQAACNKFNAGLLISEPLYKDLDLSEKYTATLIENVALRGKTETMNVYSVIKNV